ncbi:Proteasome activator complex subunit 4 [Trichophyton interdigitale]|uniref:Proteasome activator complex subunit 4 n=1 Tax=Trichophyton interdigitale TaxID=101480 RepID=A0A9P4YJW7_9EURO|nr:Proteasome activator complex subunit 4 [Trichophyton interdigitale]KAG8211076.1 Proteasome activator complex subunit 4 [Trichophyton interdigitale]
MNTDRFPDVLAASLAVVGNEFSRATSPGGESAQLNGAVPEDDRSKKARSRPRTYPYFEHSPYELEDDTLRQNNFEEILKHLYVAIESGDFNSGAVHWTRELRGWLSLKFDPTREQRTKLVKLYYELALAPGIEPAVAERFSSMFMVLTKRKHYLRPTKDLILDWKPLYRELKVFVLPSEAGLVHSMSNKRNIKTLIKLCSFAQFYFDPLELPSMLQEFLPYFTTSFTEGAFIVVGLMNLFVSTAPAPPERLDLLPQHYLPTYFHLWSLVNRSRTFDMSFLDILSRLARDSLPAKHIPFSEFGIFTEEQTSLIFTAILRLLEIPVGQATSSYSEVVDVSAGLAIMLDRDSRNHPVTHDIARWTVMSLSPACAESNDSLLSRLEGLIQAVETFFHPSNSGSWTRTLSELVNYLADFFVMRWNRERNGEMEVPPERRLNDAVKRRFVLCLRDVIFMGIYAKSGTAMNFSLSTLQSLAYLEPNLILPGALQRIYPSMQGLVEVHRTASSLRSLQVLSRIMVRTKGFRCHITTLLGLALPGIDANDLGKSLHSLAFIQSVCYNIPFEDLTKGRDDVNGNMLAVEWVTGELERMEEQGASVEMNYDTELSDEDEEKILRSSTTEFGEFLISFLGRVFTLLENLPDAARVRSGSPEENVLNTLPATFLPLLSTLSPELYDIALNKIVNFVSDRVIHQARDAMAFICNSLCKVNPEKALKRFIPLLIRNIRTEIDENGAASTRTTGSDVLPRDRGLVWNISMLSMCVVHVGEAILKYKQDLLDIALYMQLKCKGIPTIHISNFIHHLLLNLTMTTIVDYSMYEPHLYPKGIQVEQWGQRQDLSKLSVNWHVPQREEIEFAVELFTSQVEAALSSLTSLISDTPSIKRDGSGKDWSDEVTRNIVLLRLIIAGVSALFDNRAASKCRENEVPDQGGAYISRDENMSIKDEEATDEVDSSLDISEESAVRPSYQYPAGYLLTEDDPLYIAIHDIRERIGHVLHNVHRFLVDKQEDDVACFSSLYTAYRCWFIDVGIERSAHLLDRVSKLYGADIHPYKMSGIRKDYPRPLLVRRAYVYHLQRLRHNAAPRPRSKLDTVLLLDLAESSVSIYTDIRRNAQSASESALRSIWGSRVLLIRPLIKAYQMALKANEIPRIQGAIYSLMYSSLAKPVGRHWKYTPALIRAFLDTTAVDKPSIQKLCSSSLFQIVEYGHTTNRMAILDQDIIRAIVPTDEIMASQIEAKRKSLEKKWHSVEKRKLEMAEELVELAKASHWKKTIRTSAIAFTLGLRFDHIASENLIELIIKGSVDSHPGLRWMYAQSLTALFTIIEIRAICHHNYRDYILGNYCLPSKIQVPTNPEDPNWTASYLASFANPEAEYYIDHDHPGFLVWNKTMPAYKANVETDIVFDSLEWDIRKFMGKLFTRQWISTYFTYLKQEPRDASTDKFRMSTSSLLVYIFQLLLRDELTAVTFQEIKKEIEIVYEDGSDKHQHRATAEILAGLVCSATDIKVQKRTEIWEYAFGFFRKIFSDALTPENSDYWASCLRMIMQCRDPRRSWPLVDWLSSFHLDMTSNAAFKESSKINLLQRCIVDSGWHFQLEKPILRDFLAHLDHPYKGVREAMGNTLACIYRTRYHESYASVDQLIEHQKKTSSTGSRAYKPTDEFVATMTEVFDRIEQWRHQRKPGQQTPSSYTSGCKTVLLWLDSTLYSYECTQLVQFFPDLFTEQLLHMMDVKEDPELQSLAYHVFRHLPNIPHPSGEDTGFINSLIRIGRTSPSWHQRLRVMVNMQIIYFRRLFLLSKADRENLFECVASMLSDTQHEVRAGASATLSGMVRCSPVALRQDMVMKLLDRFTTSLIQHPLPKKRRIISSGFSSATSTGANTPTPEHTKLIITRHAAVLGVGALIQAFPYTSPPPSWMPDALTTLSTKAGGDPGVVGQSVKTIISDFKKTRQDTWHIDVKSFKPDQIEDLAGVLWKSYFA